MRKNRIPWPPLLPADPSLTPEAEALRQDAYLKAKLAERNALVVQYRHLPRWIITKYDWRIKLARTDPDLVRDELVLSLIRAAELYDPGCGTSFVTYASRSLSNRLTRFLEEDSRLIHLPNHLTRDDCKTHLREQGERVRRAHFQCLTREISDQSLPDPLNILVGKERVEVLEGALSHLTPREREVLEARFFDDLTLRETGERLGVTYERARQLQDRALEVLRRLLMPPTDQPDYGDRDLLAGEAASLCGVTVRAVYDWVRRGQVKTVTGDDGRKRIVRTSLDDYLARRRKKVKEAA